MTVTTMNHFTVLSDDLEDGSGWSRLARPIEDVGESEERLDLVGHMVDNVR